MTTPPTEALSAELAAIRERWKLVDEVLPIPEVLNLPGKWPDLERCNEDVPRLLAAAEAVLDLHRQGPIRLIGAVCQEHEMFPHFSITPAEAKRVRLCPSCSATACVSCSCGYVDRDRCPHRLAILGALTAGPEGEQQ